MQLKAILFDADNTLYTTAEAAKIADKEVIKFLAENSKLTPRELKTEWKKIVLGIRHSLDPGMHERRYSYGELIKKLNLKDEVEDVLERFSAIFLSHLKPAPGIPEALEKDLQPFEKAILSESEKDYMLVKLRHLDLRRYFDLVIGNEDVGAKLKPDPSYYILAFKELQVKPEECLMIGDHYEKDLEIAQKRFGLKVIYFGKAEARADACIQTFERVGEVIKDIWK